MADAVCRRTSAPYTCICFVHVGNSSQLFCDKVCSAMVLDCSCRRVVSGMLTLSGQSVASLPIPVDRSSLSDSVDVSNVCVISTAKPAAEVTRVQQDINASNVVQFVTPVKVFLLKMNTHLAGCVAKTLCLSSNFAHNFVNYTRHCAQKCAVFPVHNGYFNVDDTPVADSCLDIPSQRDTLTCITSTEDTMHTVIIVRQSVIVLMKSPRRLSLDYQWCCRLCELVVKRMELDDAMNWLSTLGGAHSSLGDHFVYHAENAAKISLKQLRVALEMGSPPVVIRCHLYFALSLLQTGRLRAAKRLILLQYQEVLRLPVCDAQLVAVCQSLWNRLRYLCRRRREMAPVGFVDKSLS